MRSLTKEFTTGNETLDKQHEDIINLINKFQVSCEMNINDDDLDEILSELTDYAYTHFAEEEAFMRSISFPEYTEHKALHQEFIKKLNAYNAQFMAGTKNLEREILAFLRGWENDHVRMEDAKFLEYV
ncbi:MAG: hemerythrin family protein [Leptospiraceae bacterium]|nr:hemerythrin family protein [Leptospiraceae bacterium]MCP5502846.1 hemerythrin family protein [Leptospiraceae bacterium]